MRQLHSGGAPRVMGGHVLALFLIPLLGVVAGLMAIHGRPAAWTPRLHTADASIALAGARAGLLSWALLRAPLVSAVAAPPGLLPYPDRNGDGNYDATADCLSGTGPARPEWRLGRLPHAGEQHPCEPWPLQVPAASATVAGGPARARRLAMALENRERGGELLWYAASSHVLDDDRLHHYPLLSVARLLQEKDGWLTVCDSSGRPLRRDVAFVVIAPGEPLPDQRRVARAPGRGHFLEGIETAEAGPCGGRIGNAAADDRFVVRQAVLQVPHFNDQLLMVGRLEFVSALAVNQAHRIAAMLQTMSRYPYAAPVGPGPARCQPGALQGTLPLEGGSGCEAMSGVPEWLRRLVTDETIPGRPSVQYNRGAAGDSATLQFAGCAIRFRISRAGVFHAPALC